MSYEITFYNVSPLTLKRLELESEQARFIDLYQYHQQHCSGIWGTACFKHKTFCTTNSSNCSNITEWELLPFFFIYGAQTNQNDSIRFQKSG